MRSQTLRVYRCLIYIYRAKTLSQTNILKLPNVLGIDGRNRVDPYWNKSIGPGKSTQSVILAKGEAQF